MPQGPLPRQDFVFHVYVDPLFGDNIAASSLNPQAVPVGLQLQPLDDHPDPGPTGLPKPVQGVLQHAPFSFKTISGSQGALAWIDAAMPSLPAQFDNGRVDAVVIHCLPGLYGPLPTGLSTIDPQSGLPFNGESFPIVLGRDRISLQGTSSLDTIFDARGIATPIVRMFFAGIGQAPARFQDSVFLDGICFRNSVTGSPPGSGAAIWIQGPSSNLSGITNCVFLRNAVGIALDSSSANGPADAAPHRTLIVNNTFSANSIGLWAFRTGTADPVEHGPAVVNNLFDRAGLPGFGPALTCFEGISPNARQVTSRGNTPVGSVDFNALDDTRGALGVPLFFNVGVGVPNFPAPPPSNHVLIPEPVARVNLAAFVTQPRTLFLADALRNSGAAISPHDLRLCPEVSPTGAAPGTLTPTIANPCVNAGIDGGPLRNLAIMMANGRQFPGSGPGYRSFLPEVPGQLNPNAEEAPVCAFDFDTEGFGNPRLVAPTGFATFPGGSVIDIGADELDRLIVAGYLDGTRMMVGPNVPNGSPTLPIGGRRVFFFGRSATSDVRPSANSLLAPDFDWYRHVQAPTDVDPFFGTANYTVAHLYDLPLATRFFQSALWVPGRPPFMRNLVCDFSPHLAMDAHPYWGAFMGMYEDIDLPTDQTHPDGYASNPWNASIASVFDGIGNPAEILTDNPFLYHNRGMTPHALPLTLVPSVSFPETTFVTAGHLNPPGTFSPSPGFPTWIVQPFATFGPFVPCSGATLSFGAFCFNDGFLGCPDRLPEVTVDAFKGRRYNLEIDPGQSGNSNLQTFLDVWTVDLPLGLSFSPEFGSNAPSLRSSMEEIRARQLQLQRSGGASR